MTITNSYYPKAYGTEQGTQTYATGNELKALLGDGWVIYGSKAVPKCFTTAPCYTVTWKNDNGTVIDTVEVEENIVPNHTDPTKTADEKYTYTFAGWTPEVVAVTGDATYTANFTAVPILYDVICENADYGTVTADPNQAAKDTQVTITAEPDANYVLSTIEAHKEYVDNRRVHLTALNGSGNTGNEGYDKLVDGRTDTKWCLQYSYGYIIVKAEKAFALNEYSLTTANDTQTYPGRNWKSWEIYGANFTSDNYAVRDSAEWQLVTSVTDDTQLNGVNFTQYDYIVSGTPAEYQYYKVELLSTKSNNISQMSELTLRYPISSYDVPLTPNSADPTKYTFDMPDEKVIVSAEFVPGGTITWNNDDGSVINKTQVKAGNVPTHAAPTKADDAQYIYTFTGWTPEITSVTGDAEYTATFAAEPKSVASVSGYSISLEGDIGINFYMELPNAIVNSTTAKVHFTIPTGTGSTNKEVDVKDAIIVKSGNKTYYVFKCQVAAKEMTSEIKAQIIDGNPVSDEFTYSVKEYADYLLTHADENGTDEQKAYAKAVPLVKAMLNYGAYSQLYFDKNTGKLANAILDEADKMLGDVTINISDPVIGTLPNGVTFEGSTLSLKSETTLSLYFKSSDTLEFACTDYNVEKATSGGYQIARIRGIQAAHIGDNFTLKINGTYAVTYSPLNYCKNVLAGQTQNEKLQNVVKAFYLYWQAAKKHFN